MGGLSGHDPVWEMARAKADPMRVYEDDSVLFATDFEGGNGTSLQRLSRDHYSLHLEPEPGEHPFSGVAYYVCFGIQNRQLAPRTVRIRLVGHIWEIWKRRDWAEQTQHLVVRRGGHWSQLDPAALHPVEGAIDTLDVELLLPEAEDPAPTLFVSNFHWWPYSEMRQYLQTLDSRVARIQEIGSSFQGRPLYAAEIGSEATDAPCLVHAQTPQPSEMGSLACRAMMDYLCSDDLEAAAIRERFRVCFIPMTNPDGTVLGYGVSDAQGRFPFFEGHLAASDTAEATPETAVVWRYLRAQRPWLFWEWHSNNWARRPGHMLLRYRPELLADSSRRAAWEALEEQLLGLPHTHNSGWTSHAEGGYQNSLGFQAVTRLGAISCMIKHHDKYPLAVSRDHAIACLKAAAAAAAAYPS